MRPCKCIYSESEHCSTPINTLRNDNNVSSSVRSLLDAYPALKFSIANNNWISSFWFSFDFPVWSITKKMPLPYFQFCYQKGWGQHIYYKACIQKKILVWNWWGKMEKRDIFNNSPVSSVTAALLVLVTGPLGDAKFMTHRYSSITTRLQFFLLIFSPLFLCICH